jgi:hypothetical protein
MGNTGKGRQELPEPFRLRPIFAEIESSKSGLAKVQAAHRWADMIERIQSGTRNDGYLFRGKP